MILWETLRCELQWVYHNPVTKITQSESKKKNSVKTLWIWWKDHNVFKEHRHLKWLLYVNLFAWSELRDTCHFDNLYIIFPALSRGCLDPWHLAMTADCDWFKFIWSFQHIFSFRKHQNAPVAFRGGIYHSAVGQFSLLRQFSSEPKHMLLIYWHDILDISRHNISMYFNTRHW